MDVFDESDNSFFKYYVYIITDWSGKPVNCSKEHIKIRWLTLKELAFKKIALPEFNSYRYYAEMIARPIRRLFKD